MINLRRIIEEVVRLGGGTTKYRYRVVAIHDKGELQPDVSEREEVVSLPNDPKLRAQHIKMHIERAHEKIKNAFSDWDHVTKFHPHEPLGTNHGTSWADDEETGQRLEFRHHFAKLDA